MAILDTLLTLFIEAVVTVCSGAWWLVALLVVAWAVALVANIAHELLGGR